ncbi:MAG: hypothetical protein V3T86_01410 [Planctomycetota bacterium]
MARMRWVFALCWLAFASHAQDARAEAAKNPDVRMVCEWVIQTQDKRIDAFLHASACAQSLQLIDKAPDNAGLDYQRELARATPCAASAHNARVVSAAAHWRTRANSCRIRSSGTRRSRDGTSPPT